MQITAMKKEEIVTMSELATEIVREHFDKIIGKEQNDYMISLFQTPSAISSQLEKGYQYFFVSVDGENIGFLAFYQKENYLYLSKFYLKNDFRGRGYAHRMLDFTSDFARNRGLSRIELNVNRNNFAVDVYKKLGFEIIREEKNDIGNGFYMDDYVMSRNLGGTNK